MICKIWTVEICQMRDLDKEHRSFLVYFKIAVLARPVNVETQNFHSRLAKFMQIQIFAKICTKNCFKVSRPLFE